MRLFLTIVVSVAVVFGTPMLLLMIGVSKEIALWTGMGLGVGAIVHMQQSSAWKNLSKKELNPLSSRFGQSTETPPAQQPVETTLAYRLGKGLRSFLDSVHRK